MAEKEAEILILEPDAAAAAAIAAALPARSMSVFLNSLAEVEEFLETSQPQLFLCADDLPGETGLMFLSRTGERWPGMQRVLMAPDLDGELFFHAMREVKVFSYLNKPVNRGELIRTIHHAIRARRSGTGPGQDERHGNTSEPAPWLRMVLVVTAGVLGGILVLAALLFIFGVLYEAKSAAGIDIFTDWHLSDLLRR
ncbi:MAG: response regulator [Verrucomicrobiaceae bacterium]|nr:MAG: response regulator [Verrucomicrobiaceae bacterium]